MLLGRHTSLDHKQQQLVSLNFTADFEIRKILPKCFEGSSPSLLSLQKYFFSRWSQACLPAFLTVGCSGLY